MTSNTYDAIIVNVGLATLVKRLTTVEDNAEFSKFLQNYPAKSHYSTTLTWLENVGCNLFLKWGSIQPWEKFIPEWQYTNDCEIIGVISDGPPREHVVQLKFTDPVQAGMFKLEYPWAEVCNEN